MDMNLFLDALHEVNVLIHNTEQKLLELGSDADTAFLHSTTILSVRLQGMVSITENDNYLLIQRIITDDDKENLTESESKILDESVHELASDIRSSYNRMVEMNSDFAGFEEVFEGSRVQAGEVFLEALEGASADIDKAIGYTLDLIN